MFWEDQVKSFLEDEKRLAELLEESKALESLKNVEDLKFTTTIPSDI